LFYAQAPSKIVDEPFYLALHCALSTAVFAFCLRAMLILDSLTNSQKQERQQSLTLQLSHRVAMYSSIPSTLLIAVVLHGAIALDLSRYLLRYESEQLQLVEQISQRLTAYLAQIELAGKMLDIAKPEQVLPALTAQRTEFISALITDQDGYVETFFKADLPQTAKTRTNVADRSYFIEPKRTGQPFISDTFLGRNLGQDQLFAISTALSSDSKPFQGVLEVSVDLQTLTSTITTSDTDISHRLLLDREKKKIWGTADDRPLGQVWSVNSHSSPLERRYLSNSWFNSFGSIMLTENAAHLLLIKYVNPGQWQLKYFIDTDSFVQRYHLFLGLAMLIALLLLEAITALSRSFISRYTVALEQLAHNATGWQPDDTPQPRLVFQQSAEEIETLANTLSEMQHRVRASRRAMQHSMQQIVTLNNELEQRVHQRTEELSNERDKATRLASIKTRFLANMSHEIRTPITVIKGFTEQLQHKLSGSETKLVERIAQNTEHLQRLVDDILDTAKIDEGKMTLELQAVPLHPFLQSVVDNITALVAQKQLTLQVDIDAAASLSLQADPFRLRQILLNLLSNAIKFTAAGQITLQVKAIAGVGIELSVLLPRQITAPAANLAGPV
jgi:signal transduction histidine kinase